jgi:hypothetical protein
MSGKETIFAREVEDFNARVKNSGRMLKLQYHEFEGVPDWIPIRTQIPDEDGCVTETCTYLRMGMNQQETAVYLQGLLTGVISFSSKPYYVSPDLEEKIRKLVLDMGEGGLGDNARVRIEDLIIEAKK